jgi:succinate-acetate transporter protein
MNNTKFGNPTPFGMVGFGITAILMNLHNAGFFPIASVILAMALFCGGLTQIIAGMLEFRRGNTFGVTAFASYGFYWIALVFIWILPKLGLAEATPDEYMGWFSLLWGIFTFFMLLGTLKGNRVTQFVFLTLTGVYGLSAARDLFNAPAFGVAAGWVGIACGTSAIYAGMAELLEEQYGRKILPF